MKKQDIFLVGFMTSGKTSFGKKLAKSLEYDFVDLDEFIEEEMDMSINTIFKLFGEDFFRQKEFNALQILLQNSNSKNRVVALGGGTICFNNTLGILKENGLVVYLELALKNIIGRIKVDKEKRPLVKDLDQEELIEKVSELFLEREQYYLKADLKIDAEQSKSAMKKEVFKFIEHQK